VRRLSLILMGGALWLILAAVPALADGGPHVKDLNNGSTGITADSCAGCHRAHTAQGPMLINAADEEALCMTCHGAAGAGATTDVASGLQYRLAARGATPLLGALRSGGFVTAAIDSSNPARWFQATGLAAAADQWAKVGVRTDAGLVAPLPVTSAHLNLPENGLGAPTVAWGNADAAWETGNGLLGPGPTVTLGCASCHNPHGNGQYRILNPIPNATATAGTFTPVATNRLVKDTPADNPDPTESDTKNYTVIQTRGTPGVLSTYLLYADDVVKGNYPPTAGDYWHVRVPWNAPSNNSAPQNGNDAPNGYPSTVTGQQGFNVQMTSWCSSCHTRYSSADGAEPSVDAIYTFRHETSGNRACTTCHVAHGSNARMAGTFSAIQPFPGGIAAPIYDILGATGDSRLLKVDNRGTCQMCHEPTDTILPGTYVGPVPTPGVP